METPPCCGRASVEECRCHTDAALLAEAVQAFVARRVRGPEPIAPDDVAQLPSSDAGDEPSPAAELAACLAPLLARIPEDYRTALELTDLGPLTQEQAAAELGLSPSGMKSRVQRGRRMLRTEVGRCCRVELDARGALIDAPMRDVSAC